jgi:hypothetical protein
MPENFVWAVKDDYTYNDYVHQESSDEKGYVTGSYRTLLPDGRSQTANYKADDYSGYVVDVKYDGEAKYPLSASHQDTNRLLTQAQRILRTQLIPHTNRRTNPHTLLSLTPNIKSMTGGSLAEFPC